MPIETSQKCYRAMPPWRDALLQPFSAQLDDIELKLTDKKEGKKARGRMLFFMLTGNAQNCTARSIGGKETEVRVCSDGSSYHGTINH
jgi:hypothetical protein